MPGTIEGMFQSTNARLTSKKQECNDFRLCAAEMAHAAEMLMINNENAHELLEKAHELLRETRKKYGYDVPGKK